MSRIRYSRSNITSSRPFDTARSRGIAIRLFQRRDLGQPPLVALLMGEPGAQEEPHQLPRQLDADHPRAEDQDVHVVVLDALMGGVAVVAQPGADAGQLVRRHRRPDAAAAEEHAALHRAAEHRARHHRGDIRIVHRLRAVGAEIDDLMAERAERWDQRLLELESRVVRAEGDLHSAPASWPRAASTTWFTVNPNFFCSSLSGADAPNLIMPIRVPVGPTYRSQPKVLACSTETRAVTSGGRTASRYSWACCSNSSHDGMLTTRARIPSVVSRSNASTQSDTSLPVPIKMTSGRPPSASARTYAPWARPLAAA